MGKKPSEALAFCLVPRARDSPLQDRHSRPGDETRRPGCRPGASSWRDADPLGDFDTAREVAYLWPR